MNKVGERDPVNFCSSGFITDCEAQLPGRREAMTCKPTSRLRSIEAHSGAVAAGFSVWLCGSQLVFIVDQNKVVRALPGLAIEQLFLSQTRRRETVLQLGDQFTDHGVDVIGGIGVSAHMRALDLPISVVFGSMMVI